MITLKIIVKDHPPFTPSYLLLKDEKVIQQVSDFLFTLEARGIVSTTLRAYAYDLLSFYRFMDAKNFNIENLTSQNGIDYLLSLRSINTAPRTINRRITVVRLFLNYCQSKLGDNIFASPGSNFYKGRRNKALLGPLRIKSASPKALQVKVPQKITIPLDNITIKTFISKLRYYRDKAIAAFMLCCGLRSVEIINLKMHDIDCDKFQILILGKGNKERLVPISPVVKATLQQYIFFERPSISHAFCFVTLKGKRRGQPMKLEAIRKIFRYRRLVLELMDVTPHRLRHQFCTSLIREKVPIPVVQKLMGHADIETTLLYTHLSVEDVAAEYQQAMKNVNWYFG